MANQPSWRFAAMAPANMNENPVQGEFFTAESDLPDRLVRESIQNSMDARRGRDPVRVRFAFSGERKPLDIRQAAAYVDGIHAHIDEVYESVARSSQDVHEDPADYVEDDDADTIVDAREILREPMTFLTVEDFGTSGLTGDIRGNAEYEGGNDFWGFFRSVGISPKGQDAGGSWGLGKWVFPDASQINAYIGVTRRADEDRTLAMGMAVLKTHSIDDLKYPPYGYFTEFSSDDDSEWLPMPVDSSEGRADWIERLESSFGLERQHRPGLSVIVPWPRPELTPDSIALSVITQYFLPILSGDLVVEIEHPGQRTRVLDTDSIEGELGEIPDTSSTREEQSRSAIEGLLKLTRWARGRKESDYIELPLPGGTRGADAAFKEFDFTELREEYNQDKPLALQLTAQTHRLADATGSGESESRFTIYLERDEFLAEGQDFFVRGYLQIPHMDHIQRIKARALVLVDGKSELGHLLRDAEGPAHTKWDPHAERLKQGWRGGGARVNEIRRAALQILRQLEERTGEIQRDALADLFPADLPSPSSPAGGTSNPGGEQTPPDPPDPSAAGPFQFAQVKGGLRVTAKSGATIEGDTQWRMRMAYAIARGGNRSAFNSYDAGAKAGHPDFDLNSDIRIAAGGCSHDIIDTNELLFSPQNNDFQLKLTGFDERDIVIDLVEHEALP